MTTTTLTKLPASNIEVPASDYHVTNVRTLQTWDGTAYTATLRHGKRIVATLNQEGRGGMTFAHWINNKAEADFNAYADQYEGKWAEATIEGGLDWDTESVIEALVGEVILQREITRKAKKAILILDPECPDPTDGYQMIKGTTHEDPRLKAILAKFCPNATAYWNGTEWTKP
jgi:hypothetical protein